MSLRQNAALHLAPLTIRVALGLIFMYYGAGKLFYEDFVLDASQEQTLVSLGAIPPRPGGPTVAPTGDTRAPDAFRLLLVQDEGPPETPTEEAVESDTTDATPDARIDDGVSAARTVRRVYGLVFAMNRAVQKGMWPDFLASGSTMRTLAWVAAISEFVGGFFVLLGVFTRLWAFMMVGTMAGAIYLTQIVPSWNTGGAFLGILPAWSLGDAATWIPAYEKFFFQLMVAAGAKAVFFSGAGAISVDRFIFGRRKRKKSSADANAPQRADG